MRVFLEAYGCSQNRGEAHALGEALHAAGHSLAPAPDRADVGVLVTCGVIGATEARMVRRWHALAGRVPRTIVTGCLVPLRTDLFDGPARDRTAFVPIRAQSTIPDLLAGWDVIGPSTRAADDRAEAPERPATAEVVLTQGCASHCTYCFSRLARGPLRSRSLEEVRERVRAETARGTVEIRLTSLDTSCWGAERPDGVRLPDLLRELGGLPGAFRLRVGMMSPQSLGPIAERLWPAMAESPTFRFLHLPVQSGSDRVLAAMRRGYRRADVLRLVARARTTLTDLALSTDVIVGFPGETESEFQETVDLLDELAPEIVNVTRFSPRPLTPAALLPPVPSRRVKERSRRLTLRRMALARRRLERWIGREVDAWRVEPGTGGTTLARLENYLPVVLPEPFRGAGAARVRIDGARSTYLVGRTTSGGPPPPASG